MSTMKSLHRMQRGLTVASRTTQRSRFHVVASSSAPAKVVDKRAPREENVAGSFFVDHTCIGGFYGHSYFHN
jgi:hypothetical protein